LLIDYLITDFSSDNPDKADNRMLKFCDLRGGKKEKEEEEDHVSYRQWKRGVLRSAIRYGNRI
jgi:hypothetical protein